MTALQYTKILFLTSVFAAVFAWIHFELDSTNFERNYYVDLPPERLYTDLLDLPKLGNWLKLPDAGRVQLTKKQNGYMCTLPDRSINSLRTCKFSMLNEFTEARKGVLYAFGYQSSSHKKMNYLVGIQFFPINSTTRVKYSSSLLVQPKWKGLFLSFHKSEIQNLERLVGQWQ